jgi:hypothetical protein
MIASGSKNNDNYNVVFLAPVAVVLAAVDEGGTFNHSTMMWFAAWEITKYLGYY